MGADVSRVEDDRLLTGRAQFVADIHLPNMADVAVVRSPLPHARILGIDHEDARSLEGVRLVVTAADLIDVAPFPDSNAFARSVAAFPLARDRVRYVGAPVAAVVADDRYIAEDAAEMVRVDYDMLDPVVIAGDDGSGTRLYDDWPDNRMLEFRGADEAVDAVFDAGRVVSGTYTTQRHGGVPLETRGCVASFDGDRLTLWSSTQSPHWVRTILSRMLPLEERDIRVITPDVGGGFGTKSHMYPEEPLVAWLALQLGHPVRWIEDRLEHLVSANHAREHRIDIEAALSDDGRIEAVRGHVTGDVGSGEIWFAPTGPTVVASGMLTGPYKIDHAATGVTCWVTDKTPAGAYRGYGQPEGVFALERIVDKSAKEQGIDPVEIRRRMLLTQADLPYTTSKGYVLDSGSFSEAFERTVEIARGAYEEALRRHGDEEEVRVGLGFATYWEGTSPSGFLNTGEWGAHESCSMRLEPDGSLRVAAGVTTTGQGVSTMIATLAADAVGVPLDSVRVLMGDTDTCPQGQGGWGSRSTVMGGGAVLKAAARVREKILAVAAHTLEADVDDLTIADGRITVRGTDVETTVRDVAEIATVRTYALPAGMGGGIEATEMYEGLVDHWPDATGRFNPCPTYSNASHAAVVKVDIETGEVAVLTYVATHDCGPVVNPRIVQGQVEGGIAQGLGGALLEELVYSPEGYLQVAGLMDYLIPTAAEMPNMIVEHLESPSPNTPLGLKGVGEGGVIGGAAAIGNAVADALEEFGVDIASMPLSPPRVWQLLQAAIGERG